MRHLLLYLVLFLYARFGGARCFRRAKWASGIGAYVCFGCHGWLEAGKQGSANLCGAGRPVLFARSSIGQR